MKYSEIRPAVMNDIDGVVALYLSLCGRPGCTWDEGYPNREIAEKDIRAGDLFIRCDETGKPVAAISVTYDPDLDTAGCWDPALAPEGSFMRVAVCARLQGQGIARGLVRFALEELMRRGYKGVRYLVSPMNNAALACYAHFGFKTVGECELFDEKWLCCESGLPAGHASVLSVER